MVDKDNTDMGRDEMHDKYREYMDSQIEIRGMDIEPDDVMLKLDGRLTSTHGKYKGTRNGKHLIKISTHTYDGWGWEEVKETIRHELIHVKQRLDGDMGGHGESFKKHMDDFEVSSTRAAGPARKPKYTVYCTEDDCTKRWTRQKACKLTKKAHWYSCQCGGSLEVLTRD